MLRLVRGVLDKRRVAALCMSLGCSVQRGGRCSDWDSLACRTLPDGEIACGHSHLVGDRGIDAGAREHPKLSPSWSAFFGP